MTPDFMHPKPSPELLDLVLKTKLLTSFEFFTRYFHQKMTGGKFTVAHHHDIIFKHMENVAAGGCPRTIMNIPPRHGKTAITVIYFIPWILANNPSAKFLHISYSSELAGENSSSVRNIIKSEEFQRLFPDVKLRTDSDAKGKWWTTAGGGVYATSSGSAVTGFGCGSASERIYKGTGSPADGFQGCMLVDDANKAGELSEVILNTVNDNYVDVLATRMNSPTTPVVNIQQRLAMFDLTGFLLDGGSGEEWFHIKIPALDENDKALWADVMDAERLLQMKRANPLTFEGQYQQEPYIAGGSIFPVDEFRYYKVAPVTMWRCIYGDTALKTKEENDYSVFQCWGVTSDYKAVLLDQVRGKWESPELLKNAQSFWNKHKAVAGMGTLRCTKIEDKASGTGLIQQLPGKGIPVEAIQRNIDKVTRAHDGAPFIASGMVYLPEDAEWISDYTTEFSAFPNGKHDDQIDPTLDAIDDLLAGGSTMLIPSETIISSMQAGSGIYLGTDPLICGVYVARDDTEHSVIQFRRGKDAMTEQTYCISYEKSKDPLVLLNLVTRVISKHKPDMSFIADSNLSGVISDKMVDLGFNALRINMHQNADQVLKYSNKLAECCWDLRVWMMGGGSIQNDDVLEQSLVQALQDYKKDKLVIVGETPRLKALALTFAYDVPDRVEEQTFRDRHVAQRDDDDYDYDPLQ